MEKERNIRFDKYNSQAMKGIAIVMMLLHHMYLKKSYEGYDVSYAPFPEDTMLYMCNVFKICVPIFAFISGYGLYLSYRKKRTTPVGWTVSRLIKTMSGFWIIWILSAIIFQAMFGFVTRVYFSHGNKVQSLVAMGIDFLGLKTLFGTASMNGTWWYMSAAVIFILLVPLVMKLEDCLPMVLALVVAFPHIVMLDMARETDVYTFIPVFLMGMCVAKYDLLERWLRVWNKIPQRVVKFLLELLVLFLFYKAYGKILPFLYNEIRWGIFPIIVVAFCAEFINVIPGIRQILLFLGKHSMNVFLVHTFIRHYFWKDFIYSFGHFIPDFLALLVTSLAVSIALEWLKKVSGYNRLIQNICMKIG
ncbi:MAG: acyltransferase [Blautia sp.]|uniref:acyltransferase family protein n=1 Tax=Blautia sp. TaxID=1955243 RepID=UPI002E774A83|nr:acyltransferase [Blautia sp.]MEE0040395.1 acyltransferase [Blautia sp.]